MKQKPFKSGRVIPMSLSLGLAMLLIALTQCEKGSYPVNGDPSKFTYLAEAYPPFNYSENGSMQGISVDLLEDIFKNRGIPLDRRNMTVSDWKTSYETTLTTPNTMLFSMVNTTERSDLFKWVGPIAPLMEMVIGLKSSNAQITVITDLNNFFTGAVEGYSSLDLLMDRGILRPNIILFPNYSELYKGLMETHEVQFISTSQSGHNLIIQAMGYSAADFTVPVPVHSDNLYFAFNIETSDEMIADFQAELDHLKTDMSADGSSEYQKILNRYSLIQHGNDGITDDMVISLVNRTSSDLASDAPGTISKINQGLSPYKDPGNPDLYSFAYDTTVVMVAHPVNPSLVGVSFAGKPDATGKNFRDDIINGALANGTGWINYVYTKPDMSGLFFKTTYYQLTVGSDSRKYVVCSGKYN